MGSRGIASLRLRSSTHGIKSASEKVLSETQCELDFVRTTSDYTTDSYQEQLSHLILSDIPRAY